MKILRFLLLGLILSSLVGCKDSSPVSNMNRTEQDKAFAGNRDPNFLKTMQDKYAKQSGPPSGVAKESK